MSMHSFPKIDQKEYLKKYLSGDKVKKKKKNKKHKKSSASSVKVKIIDDDINNLDTGVEIDEELLFTGDDAPQIVGEYIEENPAERKVPKWKSIVIKDEPEDDSDVNNQNKVDLWGRKSDDVRVKREYSGGKNRSSKIPDHNSQYRKSERKRKSSSLSPPRRHHKSHSPPRRSNRDESSSRYRKKEMSSERLAKIKTEPKSPQYKSLDQNPTQRQNDREDSFEPKSPRRRRNSDQSPPRRCKSPLQNNKIRSSYHSPSRHGKDFGHSLSERNHSPLRRKRNSLRRDSDQSPQRIYKISDQSPPRRRRNSDQSPPRRVKRRDSERFSPHRNAGQKADFSPVRKVRSSVRSPLHRRRNSDQSPPRKIRNSPDQSPLRRRRKSPVATHRNSPPTYTKQEKQTLDLSPQLRRSRWRRQELDASLSPPPTHKPKPGKTLEGKKAGLQDAKALQKETIERRKQEDLLFKKMSSDISGRNAEVQVRSTGRKGRRAREAAEEDSKERRRKEEHEEKKKLLYERWGKGLKQIEDHKNRMLEQQYESSKPLARYSNDEDLERHLKEKERLEDPMLEYMRQKRKEKEKQSGKPQIPRYEGPYPENRFGIRPGYRWDGVDRSNGYEKRYFAAMNEKKARQDEAYKYSVEDM